MITSVLLITIAFIGVVGASLLSEASNDDAWSYLQQLYGTPSVSSFGFDVQPSYSSHAASHPKRHYRRLRKSKKATAKNKSRSKSKRGSKKNRKTSSHKKNKSFKSGEKMRFQQAKVTSKETLNQMDTVMQSSIGAAYGPPPTEFDQNLVQMILGRQLGTPIQPQVQRQQQMLSPTIPFQSQQPFSGQSFGSFAQVSESMAANDFPRSVASVPAGAYAPPPGAPLQTPAYVTPYPLLEHPRMMNPQ